MKNVFNLVGTLENAMTFHRHRQSVLTTNVANLDTPNYKPVDFERTGSSAGSSSGDVALRKSRAGHLGPDGVPPGRAVVDASGEPGPDGNAVNLEHEMAKIDANRLRYAASSEMVSRRLAMVRYASSDGGA